jgi:uncharacterized protein YndB with AHSA1/START domain
MRFVGRLLVALLAIAATVAATAYLLPREVTVTREIVIAAPPAKVFPHLNALQKVAEWSPWVGTGPGIKVSFAGPAEGVGNRMTWTSADPGVGGGSQEIIVSVPDRRVETAVNIKGMGVATAWQVLKPEDSGTRVIWGLLVDVGMRPVDRYAGLMLDRRMGAEFEKGLAKLKALVEAE